MSKVSQNFSNAAEQYDTEARLQRLWRQRVLKRALDLLPREATILDMGCGTGSFAREAAGQCPSWIVTGVDNAPGMIMKASMHGPAFLGDIANLPEDMNQYDAVVSSTCLQWVEDKQGAFYEIARVLKPGGLAVLLTLADGTLQELHSLAPDLKLLPMASAEHYRRYAQLAGFTVLEEKCPREQYHYDSVRALLRSMQDIGAGGRGKGAPKLTVTRLKKLEATYAARYRHAQGGIVASWQPLLLVLRKDAA